MDSLYKQVAEKSMKHSRKHWNKKEASTKDETNGAIKRSQTKKLIMEKQIQEHTKQSRQIDGGKQIVASR